MSLNVIKLLQTLIDIPSTTGSEKAVGEYVEKLLGEEGFILKKIPVNSDTFCLYATTGKPRIVLQAHLDVVPPHIPPSESPTHIFGRGACDTKASVASMIIAGIEARKKGVTDFGLLFTVDEEKNFAGAQACIADHSLNLPFMIVGEPTQLQPVCNHYGLLVITIITHGVSAHSSEPQQGKNAIDQLTNILEHIVRTYSHHPETLSTVVFIKGGTADNIIPDKAEATISMRIAPHDVTDHIKEYKRLLINKAELKVNLSLHPVSSSVPPSLSFLGKGKTVKYCTELSFFQKGIILGPGDISFAHSDKEQIEKTELHQAVELYKKILITYV